MAEKALASMIKASLDRRHVDELVHAMGLAGISISQVSKLCKDMVVSQFECNRYLIIPGPPEVRNPESRSNNVINSLEGCMVLDSGFAGCARAPE